MTDPEPADEGGFAPIEEQQIRRSDIPTFREMAKQAFYDELEAIREHRGEFTDNAETVSDYANAAARACSMALAFIIVTREVEDSVCPKPVRRRKSGLRR